MGGDQNFLGWSKGGDQFFFSVGPRGDQNFNRVNEGGRTKIFSQFFFLRLRGNYFLDTYFDFFCAFAATFLFTILHAT